jgi:hypothetical protein
MPEVCYIVTARVPDTSIADRYVRWLQGGHIQAVLAGGAASAAVLSVHEVGSDRPAPIEVVSQYTFPSVAEFERYERESAPGLRAEGARLFGQSGIVFKRQVGEVITRIGGST